MVPADRRSKPLSQKFTPRLGEAVDTKTLDGKESAGILGRVLEPHALRDGRHVQHVEIGATE